ncbi:MAG: OmpA family protein [Flavobacteriales bacterium]
MMHRFLLSLFLANLLCVAKAQDAAGCEDHPVITRYPGADLVWCENQNHVEYHIALGPVTGYRNIDEWRTVTGERTRLYYSIKGTTSLRDIYLNYRQALNTAQATIVAEGTQEKSTSPEVGGRKFLLVHFSRNEFPPSVGIKLLNGSATAAGSFYVAGDLNAGGVPVHVVVSGAHYSNEEKLVMVDIIEEKSIATDKIVVSAAWMKQQLDRYGKVAINDILFDTDKATMQASSAPVINEIAKLLGMMPELNVFVVGHTDMTGPFQHNMDLSADRAAEVVRVLVTDHGIAKARLEAHGVGPLAPVATQRTDEGRQLNRRVELVAR